MGPGEITLLRTGRPLHSRYARRILAAIALLIALPSGLAAQGTGQTPENAQAFLTKVVAAGGVQVTAKSVPELDYGWSEGFFSHATVPFPMASATWWKSLPQKEGDFCTSEIGVYGKYGERRATRSGGSEIVRNSLWSFFDEKDFLAEDTKEYATVNGAGILVWTYVSAVEVGGPVVTLPITYAGGGIRFQFPTADVAKRAGFAMEVIRLACDATADENF